METLTYTGALVMHTCWCGVHHAIPAPLDRQARENGTTCYCPLGHAWIIGGDTELKKAQQALKRERDRAARLAAERDQVQASLAATKGVVTKLRKRASAGVCPCCNRTFQQLARHMKTKHPDFPDHSTT